MESKSLPENWLCYFATRRSAPAHPLAGRRSVNTRTVTRRRWDIYDDQLWCKSTNKL